jgi:Tol biopolymer transport system component
VSSGVDTYTSVAASADGWRLVATLASMKTTLWLLSGAGAEAAAPSSTGTRMPLSTGSGFAPRLGPGYVVYVSSADGSDSIWKQQGDTATQLWTAPNARIVGAPSIDPGGRRVAFSVRQSGHALMYVINADGTDATIVDKSRDWQGGPAWTPNGRSITAAALESGVPHLFTVPLEGGAPAPLGHEQALDPVWSPDGRFVVFSGADIGTTFPLKAIAADGTSHVMPSLTLSRGARHLRFISGDALVVLKGDIRHKNLWSVDLRTGAEHQLTNLPSDFEVRDFDLSPDGREIVLERAQAHSEIVLIDVPRH